MLAVVVDAVGASVARDDKIMPLLLVMGEMLSYCYCGRQLAALAQTMAKVDSIYSVKVSAVSFFFSAFFSAFFFIVVSAFVLCFSTAILFSLAFDSASV